VTRRVPQYGHACDPWTLGDGLAILRRACAFESLQALELAKESAMRDTDNPWPAPLPPLGHPTPKPGPAPTPWKQLRPGVWQGPDGKLATEPPKEK
jgi:hypothetical protein